MVFGYIYAIFPSFYEKRAELTIEKESVWRGNVSSACINGRFTPVKVSFTRNSGKTSLYPFL